MDAQKPGPIPVSVKAQQAPQPEQPQQREVPIERILARYGRTHLMLLEAEEELSRGRTLVQHFQQKFSEAATRIASLSDDLAASNRLVEYLQERLKQHEPAEQTEQTVKDIREGKGQQTSN